METRSTPKTTLIRYRTRPADADDNARLIRDVFHRLSEVRPAGLRYAALRAADASFYHLVMVESGLERSPLLELDAFRAFQEGVRARCVEPPTPVEVTLLGAYRMVDA